MSRVLILGGDGYLGWPTAMYFSMRGHDVTVVDNYFRRSACNELGVEMLYPTPDLIERAVIWHQKTGYEIKVVIGDLSEPELMSKLFDGRVEYQWAINKDFMGIPDTVIHYAEQPSAPYSMSNWRRADITLMNNLRVTNNLMWAVREYSKDTHIIKLGTMGEYGTPNIDIEEGWLEIDHKGRRDKFLFPRQAGSLYHTTKIMDTDLLWWGVRMWGLRVTDLMQGPVYGIETKESLIDERLRTIFNYDFTFGTVLNRFVVQAIAGHPLTVYGKGGQTRGYINIKDTLQCVYLSFKHPAECGELKIYNQIMETFSVNELAELVVQAASTRGYAAKIKNLPNPRVELEEHYYNPVYNGLKELGVKPHLLTSDELDTLLQIVEQHERRINKTSIMNSLN